jgi:hypothetical protein
VPSPRPSTRRSPPSAPPLPVPRITAHLEKTDPVWEALSGRPGYGHVALDVVSTSALTAQVHTFWTGVALDLATGRPLLFRTTVHGLSAGRALAWGWTDIRAATEGHTAVLNWITDGKATDSHLPGSPAGP